MSGITERALFHGYGVPYSGESESVRRERQDFEQERDRLLAERRVDEAERLVEQWWKAEQRARAER